MNKNIFISRVLESDSLFQNLKNQGYHIQDLSLIEIIPLPLVAIPSTNWIFFYSKNGVKCFFDQLIPSQKEKIANQKIAVFGSKTDALIEKYLGRNSDFVGHGSNVEIISNFITLINKEETILFIQAANSKRTIQQELQEESYYEIISYKNNKADIKSLEDAKHNIFTSPLNVEYFFDLKKHDKFAKYYVIGNSTYKKLLNYVPESQIIISKNRTEESLYDAIKKELNYV
jgi:uroporphyrinogen-III synthase